MKTIDALNILEITEETITLEAVKKAYRKASKRYHPDFNPAGLAMMQTVNEAYESLSELSFPIEKKAEESFTNYGSILNDALNKIVHLFGVQIEVCGSWVWVSGNTKLHKDIFNESGFKYSGKKAMWYFRPENQKKRYFRGTSSIDEIRTKYGSERVQTQFRRPLI
jgi:curved DNA-binding protein CbpA